jgi:opacity protein-like surface antigen
MTAGKGIVILALLLATAPALAQSRRAGINELYVGPLFTDGKSYSFEDGGSAHTASGYGLTLGLARHFSPRLSAGVEIGWSEQDYRATVQPGPGNPNPASQINGKLESRMLHFIGTYNLSANDFTPFVTGGLGWTHVDTNIPAGLPESVCWYYPWFGSYCATYVPTQTTTRFSYNVGAGLRLDSGKAVFRFLVNSQSLDFGGTYGSSNVIQYRIDFGTKF